MTHVNLTKFRGQTCVIDISCWLYRGAFSCAADLNKPEQSLAFMSFPLKMLKLLICQYQIKPICVFDGRPHAGKVETEKKRAIDKQKNREKAQQFEREGKIDEARKYYTRSIFIKSKQLDLFAEILDELKIEHVTAPYEADAQIAYMVKEGIADFAITEDSDLVVFGCPKVLLKITVGGYSEVGADEFEIKRFRREKDTDSWAANLKAL